MSSNFSQNMASMVQAYQQMNANKPNNFQIFGKDYQAIMEGAENARETKKRLEHMTTLNQHGKMGSPVFASVMKKFGLDFPALFSTDSQRFEKLSYDMTKGIQAFFGSRISQGTIEMFLETVPKRTMTKEGRQAVIDTLTEMIEPAIQKGKILNQIIEKNGGQLPDNFMFLLSREMEKLQDKAEEKITQIGVRKLKGEERTGMDEMPDAATWKGYYFRDKKMLDPNGNPAYLVSNGKEWQKFKPPAEADESTMQTDIDQTQPMEETQ